MIDRNYRGSLASFIKKFSDWHDGRKAAWGLATVCLYAQSLEYVTDYYYSASLSSRGSGGGEDQCTRCGSKIEVEQFGVPGRLMCGDCEDTESFHLQMLEAFYECPDFYTIYGKEDKLAHVLHVMRHIMVREYVALTFIEAVNLSKQTATGNSSHSNHTASSFYDRASSGSSSRERKVLKKRDYSRRVGGSDACISDPSLYHWSFEEADSAHACLKLIPKMYFRRCVARYYGGKDPFQPNDTKNASLNRFFHYKPSGIDMPCLEGEGTSLLFTCDEEDPPNLFRDQTNSKSVNISEIVYWTNGMDEIIKSPIYSDKGFSPFLKGPLWACTNETWFKNTFTFAFCRKDEESGTFRKGVSHEQISYKSESIYVIPYAETTALPLDEYPRDPLTVSKEESTWNTFFGLQECSSTMIKVCTELLQNRQTAIDIITVPKDPHHEHHVLSFPNVPGRTKEGLPKETNNTLSSIETSKGVSESKPYNMLKDDAHFNVRIQERLCKLWTSFVNSKIDPKELARKDYARESAEDVFDESSSLWRCDYFSIDTAYFNPETLAMLMAGIFKLAFQPEKAVKMANKWDHGQDHPARKDLVYSSPPSLDILSTIASAIGINGSTFVNPGSCFVYAKLDQLSHQLAVWRISLRLKSPYPTK